MKSFYSILFLYLVTFLFCGSNRLQDLKEIDSIINKSVENDYPGLGVGILKDGEFIRTIKRWDYKGEEIEL